MTHDMQDDPSWLEKLGTLGASLRPPRAGEKVWKEECAFSFETPESAQKGLFLNMTTFQVFSEKYVPVDNNRTGNVLYLNIKYSREEPSEEDKKKKEDAADENPTKLAIGVEGGFSPADVVGGKGKLVKEYGFVIFPDLDSILPYPCDTNLPIKLIETADQLIAMDDASAQMEVKAWDAADEPRPVSKHADNLPQLDNGVKISPDPKTWKCAESGMTENLWLNLSTGYIGSGRRNWDGTGGTGAALSHYESTGRKFPLCVKLGTITADGSAEVYSYDPAEDCLVQDPDLGKHLRHFGINIMDMKKTEKTMLEMEIELNKSLSFAAVLENGEELIDCYGPGNVGLFNLGNSCYANSVYQVLMAHQSFQERFVYGVEKDVGGKRGNAFLYAPEEPQSDVMTQFVKLASAFSDPFGIGLKRTEDEGVLAVQPKMLKDALGQGHVDYSGREQQDAREYFQHVLDKLSRADFNNKSSSADPGQYFSFLSEERLECCQSNMVQYKSMVNNVLLLNIPFSAQDQEEWEQKSKKEKEENPSPAPCIPFEECLHATLGEGAKEEVEDYLSPATGKRGVAEKQTSLATFPRYLAVQLKRYVIGDNWVPKKLDCRVPVPRHLDLNSFRGNGIQDGEVKLPESDSNASAAAQQEVVPDPELLSQLASMGFSENGCKRALIAVNNAGAEEAMQWVFQHMEDPDFNDPPAPASSPSTGTPGGPDPEHVAMLSSMGFSEDAVRHALKECSGDMERAADWLFSHASEIDEILASAASGATPAGSKKEDQIMNSNDAQDGKYALRAFISHLGKTTTGGHYLCHINRSEDLSDKSNDEWVICNDRKVAKSKNPPFEYGFMYFFERITH